MMNLKKYFVLLFFALFCMTISNQPAGSAESVSSSKFQSILNSGKLRVGVALFTPWVFKDKNGDLAGFEIDVAEKLANDMGLKPNFSSYDWDNLIPALLRGEIDVIVSGMAITPQRALKINFSQPYATAGINIATNVSLTEDIHGLEELNQEKIKIGVVAETVSEEFAEHLFEKAKIIKYKTSKEVEDDLVGAKIHVYMESKPIPRFIALEHPGKIDVPVGEPLLITKAGFAIKKGDPDFLNFLNSWIIARESDTWLNSIHDYWFKSLKWRKKYLP
ncbi:MAG: polar amino acid transport system substrate-binding protein [Nitrospinales bacterium]|jgi:polar amino acid transport system substrate-binding protein